MTPKEFAELKKLRVRVENQRQEIKRLQAENAELKAAQMWTVVRKPSDMPPLTDFGDSVTVLFLTVHRTFDVGFRNEDCWVGNIGNWRNDDVKAWIPIPERRVEE